MNNKKMGISGDSKTLRLISFALFLSFVCATVCSKTTLEKIGAPTTSEELGVSKKKIVEALVRSTEIRPDRYTILGERGLTEEAARALAKNTGVI